MDRENDGFPIESARYKSWKRSKHLRAFLDGVESRSIWPYAIVFVTFHLFYSLVVYIVRGVEFGLSIWGDIGLVKVATFYTGSAVSLHLVLKTFLFVYLDMWRMPDYQTALSGNDPYRVYRTEADMITKKRLYKFGFLVSVIGAMVMHSKPFTL